MYHDDRDHDDNVTRTALLPFILAGLITYHPWDRRGQIEAYNHCKDHYGSRFRWQAMIDDDEYLVIPSGGWEGERVDCFISALSLSSASFLSLKSPSHRRVYILRSHSLCPLWRRGLGVGVLWLQQPHSREPLPLHRGQVCAPHPVHSPDQDSVPTAICVQVCGGELGSGKEKERERGRR